MRFLRNPVQIHGAARTEDVVSEETCLHVEHPQHRAAGAGRRSHGDAMETAGVMLSNQGS